jgi:methyl coenzyme M reductase gamma subunit
MDINVLKSAIMLNGYSNSELNELGEAIKYARNQLGREVKRSIRVGDNVNFSDIKRGTNYTGSVIKINIKYVHVATSKGTYRVPANMLTVV